MTILHAHSDPDFVQHLRRVLDEANGQPHSVDIAVGYFYLSGFRAVSDLLANRPGKVRLLLGRTDRPTQQEIAAGYSSLETAGSYYAGQSRHQEQAARDETVANVGRSAAVQPQDDASAAGIASLAALIAGGQVEVRAYLKERMHAKAYIGYTGLQANPGTAIIGSTNFSASGFAGNTELNYPVTHSGDVLEVKEWFERLWSESEPVSAAVVEQLKASWPLATPDPYLIYLKILYELYGDTLGDGDLPPAEPPVELTDYQRDAVAAGLAMLDKHNGCYIADVVGLGKTYIGAEILRRLTLREPQAGDPLVICPAPLTAMWERVCDQQFGIINADVISIGRLTEANYRSDRSLRKTLRNAGPVLIDEAHNFRNNNQRRRVLLDFLKGNRRHKTILLSATPQNLAPRDILRQLELFLDPANHGLPGIDGPLYPYFPDDTAEALDEGAGEVLRHILLRRRRQDITRHYPNSSLGGQPIRFPATELSNQQYSLEHAYRQAGGLNKIVRLLKRYQASRYRHAFYLTAAAREKPEYRQLQNPGKTLSALIRVLLFKRLESSIPAFRSTLENIMESNRAFRDQIISGAVSRDDGISDADEEAAEREPSELDDDYIIIKDQSYNAADFRCAAWARDLEKDADLLRQIHDGVKDLTPEDDAKLDAIKSFVVAPGVKDEKILVFTESQVTARYLYRELTAAYPQEAIDLLTGDDSRAGGQDKMSRFSPVSNGKPDLPAKEQTRILIATDVLSQGQNLQDCGRMLNYDLHWNPVTIIQRYGRIDRVTTEHQVIHLHNMLPDAGVERQIDLTGKLSERVQSFHDFIGLDDAVLQQTEAVNRDSIYAIYEGEMPAEDDRFSGVAMAQEANATLNRIRRENPELWAKLLNMPDGLRAAINNPEHPNSDSTLVLLRAGALKQGYASAGGGKVAPLTHHELATRAACQPDTPAAALPPDTNQRIANAVNALVAARSQPVALEARRRDRQVANYINRELGQLRLDYKDDDAALLRIESLRSRFAAELPAKVNDQIKALMQQKVSGDDFLQALAAMQSQLPQLPATTQPAPPPANFHAQVVCSLGIASAA